jgi:outer membrane receptor protein involved in Fe transport
MRDTDSVASLAYVTVPQHLTDGRSAQAISSAVQQDFGRTVAPSQVNPVALKLLNTKINGQFLIPSVSVTDPAAAARFNFNAVQQGAPTTLRQDQGNSNVDWNPNSKDRLSVKYFISENPTTSPFSQSSSPGFSQVLQAGSQVASADNTYVISPNLVWEQRVGFARTKAFSQTGQSLTPDSAGFNLFGSTRFPSMTIYQADSKLRNSFVIGPRNLFGNSGAFQNRYTFASTLSWVLGRHSFSFGFQADNVQLNIINPNNEVATLESNDFADFAAGTPLVPAYSYLFAGATNRYYRAWQSGVFAQDVVKLRPNLTVNLGLRLDYNGPFHEKYGNLANFLPGQVRL